MSSWAQGKRKRLQGRARQVAQGDALRKVRLDVVLHALHRLDLARLARHVQHLLTKPSIAEAEPPFSTILALLQAGPAALGSLAASRSKTQ